MRREPTRILIADDDENVLITLEHALEGEGYRTATAWSAQQALALSEQGHFDLLLIDEYLSGTNVDDLLQKLRQRQPHALRVLLRTHREGGEGVPSSINTAVYKWDHVEMKEQIRSYLAA